MFTLWENENVYDAGFENKKQQKHKAFAAQEKTYFLTQYH
jgi:transposase